MKRIFDVALSGTGLLLSSPIWLLIALAIKLDDRGPVFYIPERVGRNGKNFRAYKFRSMKVGAHQSLQATENDPRVTRVGRFLRATALDELPQLLNIFLGDMSFVGPRALLPAEMEIHGNEKDEQIVQELFVKRCAVTPGLTGVAQVFAPRDVPRRKKFRYDLFYIRHKSFWFDLKLIFISFWITFRGKWESRGDKLERG
jgi:lipopolysaccharide/colanic/teichoic acid biosynthesis glycosyltransferase